MSDAALSYEIRTVADPEGRLRLELWVEERLIATAGADLDVLDAMQQQLGLSRDDVAQELRTSLEALLKN